MDRVVEDLGDDQFAPSHGIRLAILGSDGSARYSEIIPQMGVVPE
jgi:hypothetical protein